MTVLPRRTRVAALAMTAALGTALAGCGSDDGSSGSTASDPADSSSAPSTDEPTDGATDGASSGDEVSVPVFFVGDTPTGPRLFSELREVPSDNPLEEAAALVAAGDALDPDYRSVFPDGSFAGVSYADGAFRVDLPDDAWVAPAGLDGSDEAILGVQQLVYTLQGVQQEDAPVTVYLDDAPVTLFGVDTAAGVTAEPEIDLRNLVNVTAPAEGDTVSGTFTASGVASSYEANVPWQIRRGDETVLDGFATAEGWMDELFPWETEIDVSGLEPGEYTFVALTDDPSGGEEGPGAQQDTKTITVE